MENDPYSGETLSGHDLQKSDKNQYRLGVKNRDGDKYGAQGNETDSRENQRRNHFEQPHHVNAKSIAKRDAQKNARKNSPIQKKRWPKKTQDKNTSSKIKKRKFDI